MNTVITPDALKRSLKPCKLKDIRTLDEADEFFYFIFPSPNSIDQINGDGKLLEIHDFNVDLKQIHTMYKSYDSTPDTEIWYR